MNRVTCRNCHAPIDKAGEQVFAEVTCPKCGQSIWFLAIGEKQCVLDDERLDDRVKIVCKEVSRYLGLSTTMSFEELEQWLSKDSMEEEFRALLDAAHSR